MAFLGMAGTGTWSEDQRPTDYRQTMLRLWPNGQMVLTGITSMMPSEPTTDPTFNWWTKTLPLQSGQLTEVYNNALLSSAYAGEATAGDVVYVQVAQAVAEEFRPGHQAALKKEDDYRYTTRGKVEQVVKAGANSYIAIRLTETPSGTYDLDEVTHVSVIGNMNAEGATMPESLMYMPVLLTNKTQIWRTSLALTRTALRTRLRTYDQYQEARREALELHGMEIEKALLWSRIYEGIGDNGQPERATNGIVPTIIENVPENVSAYHLDPDYSGQTWVTGGEDWIDTRMETIFRYGGGERLAVVGSGVLLALKKLIKAGANMEIRSGTVDYGIKVGEWMTPYGSLYLKTHPLFSYDPATRNDMLIMEPRNLRVRTIDDTFFVRDPEDRRNRNHSKDAREEEWITELGLEMHNLPTFGYLSGFGFDNDLA